MVRENMGLPEPPDHDTSISSNNEILMVHSDPDDFDNEDHENPPNDPYEGYQQLPLNSEADPANDSDSHSEDEDGNQQEVQPVDSATGAEIISCEKVLLKEVWSQSQSKDIEMDSDKVKAVKDAMLNFSLPASNIPDWASDVPEHEWKEHILQKLQTPK